MIALSLGKRCSAMSYFEESLRLSEQATPTASFDPEAYMTGLFQLDNADHKLDAYITRQLLWAESILEMRLAQENAASGEAGRASARAAAGGVFAVAVGVEFSSGCVVAPQISLTHETTPIFSQD